MANMDKKTVDLIFIVYSGVFIFFEGFKRVAFKINFKEFRSVYIVGSFLIFWLL